MNIDPHTGVKIIPDNFNIKRFFVIGFLSIIFLIFCFWAWQSEAKATDAVPCTAEYTNDGGVGDRTGIITVTGNNAIFNYDGSQNISKLVDGSFANVGWFASTGNPNTSTWLKFDFGTAKIITEVTEYNHVSGDNHTFQWAGSNDDGTYTNIGSTFDWGTGSTVIMTSMSGNTTGYRYYKLYGTSGNLDGTWHREFEFKLYDSSGCGSTPVDGVCGSNNGGTFDTLTSGDANNCSVGAVDSFAGTGGWTWNCLGTGGGSNASCSASLESGTSTPTSTPASTDNTQNNLFNGILLFLISFFGITWIIRSH